MAEAKVAVPKVKVPEVVVAEVVEAVVVELWEVAKAKANKNCNHRRHTCSWNALEEYVRDRRSLSKHNDMQRSNKRCKP